MSCALVPTAARRLSVPVPDQDQDTASRPATKRSPNPADPLAAAVVGPKTAGQLAGTLGTTLEAASA